MSALLFHGAQMLVLLCSTLTQPQRQMYHYITRWARNEDTAVTHEDQKVDVAWAHLATCAEDEWLADPIMNCYIALLQARLSACLKRFTRPLHTASWHGRAAATTDPPPDCMIW